MASKKKKKKWPPVGTYSYKTLIQAPIFFTMFLSFRKIYQGQLKNYVF